MVDNDTHLQVKNLKHHNHTLKTILKMAIIFLPIKHYLKNIYFIHLFEYKIGFWCVCISFCDFIYVNNCPFWEDGWEHVTIKGFISIHLFFIKRYLLTLSGIYNSHNFIKKSNASNHIHNSHWFPSNKLNYRPEP